ncbi:TPA: type I secretion system permease/ATPase [Stenotrophomonas maltophilia]|nr:type I secretion system permease/ATPase [Stenotrophomonas maltophilia]HEL4288547.1 type I secretion system permease/ATPase [Stenotrophomonas maltophilia]
MQTGLAIHPRVRAALSEAERAGTDVKIARGGYFPALQVSGGPQAGHMSEMVYDVTLSQMLFDWGRTRSQVEAASATQRRYLAALEVARDDAALDIIETYLDVLVARERVVAVRDFLQRIEGVRGMARDRSGSGYADRTELDRAQLEFARGQDQLAFEEGALRDANNQLALLLGRDPGPLQAPNLPAGRRAWQRDGLDAAIEAAPLLRESREDAAAAEAELAESRAALKPQLNVEASALRREIAGRWRTIRWFRCACAWMSCAASAISSGRRRPGSDWRRRSGVPTPPAVICGARCVPCSTTPMRWYCVSRRYSNRWRSPRTSAACITTSSRSDAATSSICSACSASGWRPNASWQLCAWSGSVSIIALPPRSGSWVSCLEGGRMQTPRIESTTTGSGNTPRDPLQDGLLLLCERLGRPLGAAELVDGIALEHGRLPLQRVPRALRRADLNARVEAFELTDIDAYLLPVLLLLNNGNTLLLTAISDDQAQVEVPQAEGGTQAMPLQALQALYSGTAVFAKPRFRSDGRVGDFAAGRGEHWFYGPLRQLWRSYVEVGAAAFVANLLAIATAIFAMQVYDRVVPVAAFDTLWVLASGVALAVIIEGVLRVLRGQLLHVLGKRMDLQLGTLLFARVLGTRINAKPASMGAFSTQVREFEGVRDFFTSSTAALLSDLPFVFVFLLLIALIGGHVVWVPVVACVLMVLPGVLAQRRLGELSRQNLREGAMKNSVLLEAFEHLESVKATRAEGRSLKHWESLTAQLAGTALKTSTLTASLSHGAAVVQQLAYVGVVAFGVYRINDGAMTVGALVACSILSSRAIAPLAQVAAVLGRWQHTRVAMEGLDQLMGAEQERPQGARFVHRPRLQGAYQLHDVRLALGEGPWVVDVHALSIAPGQRVALLGGNGAGKSSLLRVLSGLVTPQQGRLLLDDVALAQIDPGDRARNIGYLPQDVALFHGSLRDNLNLEGAAWRDEELLEALDAVGMGPFVRGNPLGLDQLVMGNGSLSGGQRQAIGLARVILQDPPVVLLDEPTAAFDQQSETHVIQFLQRWLGQRTLVLTTHKRSMLALVERAVVMRNGRIIMDGPLEQVVQGNQVQPIAAVAGGHHG